MNMFGFALCPKLLLLSKFSVLREEPCCLRGFTKENI